MKDKNNKKYKKINSPIFNYYSGIVNSSDLQYNSEKLKNNNLNYPKNLQSPLLNLNFKNNHIKKQKDCIDNDKNNIQNNKENNNKTIFNEKFNNLKIEINNNSINTINLEQKKRYDSK